MKIDERVTVSLTEDEVKDLVVAHLASKGYKVSPEKVKFQLATRIVTTHALERKIPYIKECTINVKGG